MSQELQDLREELYELQQLVKFRGWERIMRWCKAQIDYRFNNLTRSHDWSVQGVIEREYVRGELAGIDLFQHIADVEIVRLQDEIEKLAEQLTYEEGESDVEPSDPTNLAP